MEKSSENTQESKVFKVHHPIVIALWVFIIILSTHTALANLPKCGDTVEINTNCTMLTPTLLGNCTTYSIISINSTVVINDTPLTYLNDDIYYFNFTLGEGDYIIQLCDGTTREVVVRRVEKDMIGITFIFGILLFISLGLTVYFAWLKNSFANFFLFITMLIMCIAAAVAQKIAEDQALSWAPIMDKLFWLMVVVLIVSFLFFFVHIVKASFMEKERKRQKELEDQYGPAWQV